MSSRTVEEADVQHPPPPRVLDGSAVSDNAVRTTRVRIDLAYDGSGFAGFAENRDVRTVGGTLRLALERIYGHRVELFVAGRTDKGVHARGQVVHFDTTAAVETDRLVRALNSMLAPEIAVSRVIVVSSEFHARFSAKWRRYEYSIWTDPVPDVFLAPHAWWLPGALDLDAMNIAAGALLGEHDFSTFCRRPKGSDGAEVSLVRNVVSANWSEVDNPWSRNAAGLVRFEIRAQAFCHHMVRSIVGTLVAVGRGRVAASDLETILESRDRSKCEKLAPPQGLCLVEVGYDDEFGG